MYPATKPTRKAQERATSGTCDVLIPGKRRKCRQPGVVTINRDDTPRTVCVRCLATALADQQ